MDQDEFEEIAQGILGNIVEWRGDKGILEACPGEHLHGSPSKPGDCVVFLGDVPTVTCFHQSCRAAVDEANEEIREAVREYEREHGRRQPTTEELLQRHQLGRQRRERKRRDLLLRHQTMKALPKILKEYAWPARQMVFESPVKVDRPNAWRQQLSLFQPTDNVWIGEKHHSGPGLGEGHFLRASEWRARETIPPWPLICPKTFMSTLNRKDDAVLSDRFIVLESDTMSFDDTCAMFRYCRTFMTLRAVIYSGNKSLHGWFNIKVRSYEENQDQKAILKALGFDGRLIDGLSQPSRLAGALRDNGRVQELLWFAGPDPAWQNG